MKRSVFFKKPIDRDSLVPYVSYETVHDARRARDIQLLKFDDEGFAKHCIDEIADACRKKGYAVTTTYCCLRELTDRGRQTAVRNAGEEYGLELMAITHWPSCARVMSDFSKLNAEEFDRIGASSRLYREKLHPGFISGMSKDFTLGDPARLCDALAAVGYRTELHEHDDTYHENTTSSQRSTPRGSNDDLLGLAILGGFLS